MTQKNVPKMWKRKHKKYNFLHGLIGYVYIYRNSHIYIAHAELGGYKYRQLFSSL